MTLKTITEHTSDLSGAPADVQGKRIQYNGKVFTLDLTQKESDNIDKQMAAIDAKFVKMLEKATIVPGLSVQVVDTTRKVRKAAAKVQAKSDTTALREFAAANGFEFKGRGRPSKALLEAFANATSAAATGTENTETTTEAEVETTEVTTVSA